MAAAAARIPLAGSPWMTLPRTLPPTPSWSKTRNTRSGAAAMMKYAIVSWRATE